MNKRAIIMIGGVVVACAATALGVFWPIATPLPSTTDDLGMVQAYWSAELDESDSIAVYERFKQAYTGTPFSVQHPAAHVFGALLYKVDGEQGLTVCDETFSYGCYHGFFGQAIGEQGLSIVETFDRICIETYGPYGTGCQHGIGHGIVEYLGHSEDALVDALDVCSMTTHGNDPRGCVAGAFMEYNFPVMFDADRTYVEPREFNQANPYEPCNTVVPRRFRQACYLEIGLWWQDVHDHNYAKSGRLCAGVDISEERHACYNGLGTIAPPDAGFVADRTSVLCEEMPTSEGRLHCSIGAARVIWPVPESRGNIRTLCQRLDNGPDAEECESVIDLLGKDMPEKT